MSKFIMIEVNSRKPICRDEIGRPFFSENSKLLPAFFDECEVEEVKRYIEQTGIKVRVDESSDKMSSIVFAGTTPKKENKINKSSRLFMSVSSAYADFLRVAEESDF